MEERLRRRRDKVEEGLRWRRKDRIGRRNIVYQCLVCFQQNTVVLEVWSINLDER